MESNKKNVPNSEVVIDFGEEFGCVCKQNISDLFVDIHASIAPLDPLGLKQASASSAAAC